ERRPHVRHRRRLADGPVGRRQARLVNAGRPWSLARRVGFRFALAYWVLYFPLLPLNHLPGAAPVIEAWTAAWASVALFFARHVAGRTTPFVDATDPVMDASFGYARLACVVAFAAIAAVAWSLVDRRREH